MREFFSLDGAFNRYGGFVADMIILSLMWILFSLPVITIGAATTAMFYVSTRRISNREGYITSDFWASFKANFARATILWVIILAGGFLMIFNIRTIEIFGAGLAAIILPVQIILFVELIFITVYVFPMTARFEMGLGQTIKTCFFMANRHLLTSVICSALLAAVILASFMQPLIFFAAPGVYALLASYMLMRIFKRYRPEMDRDPALEVAEMEAERAEARRRTEFTAGENEIIINENQGGDFNMATQQTQKEAIRTMRIRNKNGMGLTVANLGCAIMSLEIPTPGQTVDVVLGFDLGAEYKQAHPFFGVVCGRVANRIGGGKFMLSGKSYQLETNNNDNHLHGGSQGFDKKIWQIESAEKNEVVFTLESPKGDSGYPGKLDVRVVYTLTDENVFRIDYYATAKAETICNMTNHSYFNLDGYDAPNIYDQLIQIFSDKITAVDERLIPTGEFTDVAGTPFDFRVPKPIIQDLDAAGEVNATGGYDHNYVLRAPGVAAVVHSPKTGITMTVSTNSPGVQFYSGNFLNGAVSGKGVTYQKHSGFCLETQLFPDAINKPHFPSPIVKNETQHFYTEFKFEW
ncbi:MAG: galactose-1-epimerase [Defluviitaleaceae bacterium]|nr:galactose-1-epimerase [Defluviitaleaceae bacterium]